MPLPDTLGPYKLPAMRTFSSEVQKTGNVEEEKMIK
jgi:hypothetical protein